MGLKTLLGLKKKITVGTLNEEPRIQWICDKLKALPQGHRILDAGAGELKYKPYCSHLNYISQDFAQYDGQGDGKGLQTEKWDNSKLDIVSDITNIPEPENSFDAILCAEVFEHLPGPVLAIKEFSRLLKTSGKLIITAPFCSLTHFAPYHFNTGFNSYFYEENLKKNGLKILEITYNGNYFEYIAQELRRINSVAQQYASDELTKKEHKSITTLLGALQRFSQNDTNSKELLSFGLHILAEKI